ncbi:MAG: hypothetical protein R6X15_08085 [Pseudomonadota bacterium]
MSETGDPRPALSPPFLWRILFGANLTSLAVILFVFHRMMHAAVAPDMGLWLFAAGLLSALPAFMYQRYAGGKPVDAKLSGNARQLKQLNQVVIACALAELPGLMGTIYYLFTTDRVGTIVLLGLTVLLLAQARPVDKVAA